VEGSYGGGIKSAGLAVWTSPGLIGMGMAETTAAAEKMAKVAKEMSCIIVMGYQGG